MDERWGIMKGKSEEVKNPWLLLSQTISKIGVS